MASEEQSEQDLARELGVVLEEDDAGQEDDRLTRADAPVVRRVRAARRDTLVRLDRALTSAVDLPMVSGPEATVRKLGTSTKRGLSESEASARLAQHGSNELEASRDPNVLELLIFHVRGGGVGCLGRWGVRRAFGSRSTRPRVRRPSRR
jgi:Cation transporter/ATPase, N-terminus